MIVDVDITDPPRYSEYTPPVPDSVADYGGVFVVRGGACEVLEGDWHPRRLVVIEFPSREAALAWYHSHEYQALARIRWSASTANFVVAEGVSGRAEIGWRPHQPQALSLSASGWGPIPAECARNAEPPVPACGWSSQAPHLR